MSALAGVVTAIVVLVAALAPSGAPARRVPAPTGASRSGRPAPAWFVEGCRQLRWTADVGIAWALIQGAAIAAVLSALLLWGVAGAVIVAACANLAPRLLTPFLRRRRLAERDQQLPEAMERVAAALRAGTALGPALVQVARGLEQPLGDELRRATRRLENGERVGATLDRWAREPDSSSAVVLTASALSLGAESGGEVARAVDGVATTLRERRQLQAEVRALATQARTSAWLLASAPLAFAALVATVEPGVVRFLFGSALGAACLLVGVALDAVGVAWMARIVGRAA